MLFVGSFWPNLILLLTPISSLHLVVNPLSLDSWIHLLIVDFGCDVPVLKYSWLVSMLWSLFSINYPSGLLILLSLTVHSFFDFFNWPLPKIYVISLIDLFYLFRLIRACFTHIDISLDSLIAAVKQLPSCQEKIWHLKQTSNHVSSSFVLK